MHFNEYEEETMNSPAGLSRYYTILYSTVFVLCVLFLHWCYLSMKNSVVMICYGSRNMIGSWIPIFRNEPACFYEGRIVPVVPYFSVIFVAPTLAVDDCAVGSSYVL